MADITALPRVITNELYCIADKRTPSPRGEVLRAGTHRVRGRESVEKLPVVRGPV